MSSVRRRKAAASRATRPAVRRRPPPTVPDPPDPFVRARIAFEIPRKVWFSDFSRNHPDLVLKVHNTMFVGARRSLADFEIAGKLDDWTEEISAFPDVFSAERIEVPPNLTVYRVLFRRPDYHRMAHRREILLNYPRTVQNGVFTCETTSRSSQVRELISDLRKNRDKARLLSLQRASGPHRSRSTKARPVLTDTQESLFRQALELGYFEVPRRITLTRLAERVGRSKSAVSHALALVERYLVHTSPIAST